jgi:hypothetical protein
MMFKQSDGIIIPLVDPTIDECKYSLTILAWFNMKLLCFSLHRSPT